MKKRGRTRGEQKIDRSRKYEIFETKTPKERAKAWFNRPAYSIWGDNIGQAKTKSVQSTAKRDTETT